MKGRQGKRETSRDKESGRGIKTSESEIESDREQTDEDEAEYRHVADLPVDGFHYVVKERKENSSR